MLPCHQTQLPTPTRAQHTAMAHTDEATAVKLVRDLIRNNNTLSEDDVINLTHTILRTYPNVSQYITTISEYCIQVLHLMLKDRWAYDCFDRRPLDYALGDGWPEIVLQVKESVKYNMFSGDERIDARMRRITDTFLNRKENEYCKHSVHPGSTDMSDVIRTVDSFLDELTIEINRMAYDEYQQEDEVDLWLTMFLDELRKAEVDMCKKFAMVMMMNKVGLKPCSKKKNHSEAHEAARSGRSVTFAA